MTRALFATLCILLLAAPTALAADLEGVLQEVSLPSGSGPELRQAVERLVADAVPCAGRGLEQTIDCVYDRVQEFIPTCPHIVPCLSMVHVSVLPGYRLDHGIDWYSGQAWATLPLVPPTREGDGSMLYLCVNLEGHCGRLA
jgi:hypothetical protein